MNNSENIEKILKQTKLKTTPAIDEQILKAAALELKQSTHLAPAQKSHGLTIWRAIMKAKTTKLAAAAAVIIAAMLLLKLIGIPVDGTSVAWAEVAKNIEQIRAFSCQRTDTQTNNKSGKVDENKMMMYISSDYGQRIDSYQKGQIQVQTYASISEKSIVSIMPGIKKYSQSQLSQDALREMSSKGPGEIVKRFMSLDYKSLGNKKIDDIEVQGIHVNDPKVLSANFPIESLTARLWVDPQTNLPVEIEIQIIADSGLMQITTVIDKFKWNVELRADDFKPNIPKDFSPM